MVNIGQGRSNIGRLNIGRLRGSSLNQKRPNIEHIFFYFTSTIEKSVMIIFETVQSIRVFCSFEAIEISSAGCESLLFLLKNNCEDVSKFRIANFLFQGDSSCQQ